MLQMAQAMDKADSYVQTCQIEMSIECILRICQTCTHQFAEAILSQVQDKPTMKCTHRHT